ncbi:hypothetical protein PRZ48_000188 [Zasmidium cellare]|uniref:Small secreted protein n=1 Tax=Zasmidium cellare TaxID=395010 RepID=A0ABR0EZ78_ZASCE|nr:hypothetical protein PRZ48_000188 [Zasmidium cellare]
MHFPTLLALLATSATSVFADGWTEQFFQDTTCDNPPIQNASGSGPVACANLVFGSALPVSAVYDYSITAWTEPNCAGESIGDKDDGSEGIYCVNPTLVDTDGFQSYSISSK